MARVTVLGAGAWGSTLSDVLARKNLSVTLWDLHVASLDALRRDGHPFGVPELKLHAGVRLEADLTAAVRGADIVVYVIPSQAVAEMSVKLGEALGGATPMIVLASKGLDIPTASPLSTVVERVLRGCRVGVISGPCIAREVAQGIPTSVAAAVGNEKDAEWLRDLVSGPSLRAYAQTDVLGVELGGALKNVIAVAAGVGDGLGFGANTKAALMTRGLAEMTRLATAMGAQPRTMFGLAGLGDLAVTCFSPHSRNRTFGQHLGEGKSADAARAAVGMTVEGEPTARAALALAKTHAIDLPIAEMVEALCGGRIGPKDAVGMLMQRELKHE